MKRTLLVAALMFAAGAAAAAPPKNAGQALAGQARLTMDQARAIALKARPGTIVDQELEKEAGGSGLRYAFDIKTPRGVYEVGVDAKTGAVLENGQESAADEAREKKADKAEGAASGEDAEH